MEISITASAGATVANQPSFDLGGFPVRTIDVIAGQPEDWENLRDLVSISVGNPTNDEPLIDICNFISEKEVGELPTKPNENTAGRLIEAAILFLKDNGVNWKWPLSLKVEKGISIKGTGLGSSGATPAAALKAFVEVMQELNINYIFGNHTKAQLLMNADMGVPDNSISAYFGGLVEITQNEGEVIVKKIKPHETFGKFIVITPRGFGIKTADARKVLEGINESADHMTYVKEMQEAIKVGDTIKYGEAMENAHKWFVSPRSRLYPNNGKVYDAVYQSARDAGASGKQCMRLFENLVLTQWHDLLT